MIADFGKESSADVIKQGLASGEPTLATANLPEGGWVSNILVQGQPTRVVRDPARLEKGREALRAIQQKWDGVRALKEIAIRSANIQAEDVTSHPLVGQRILVSQPEDTTYPEPPSVRFEPAVVHYQNSLVPALRERAQSYVGRVMTELEAAGKDFRTFTTALKAHQNGELNTRGLRDLMAQLMAGHPQLMQDFESFLPRPKSNEATNNDDDRVAEHKGEHDGIEPVFVVRLTKDEQSASAGSSVSLPSLAVLKETEVSGRLVNLYHVWLSISTLYNFYLFLLKIYFTRSLSTSGANEHMHVSHCVTLPPRTQVRLGLKRLLKEQRKVVFKRLMRGLLRLLGRVRGFLNSLPSRRASHRASRNARAITAWASREPTPIQRVLGRW